MDFSAEDKASGVKFAWQFMDVQGRESPIFVNLSFPEAQNRTNRPARVPVGDSTLFVEYCTPCGRRIGMCG